MNKLTIAARLSLLVGVLAVAMLLVGSLGLYGIRQSNDALESVYQDRTVPAAHLGQIRTLAMNNRLYLNMVLDHPSAADASARLAKIDANTAEVAELWSRYMATHLTTREGELAAAAAATRERYYKEGFMPARTALAAGDIAGAKQLVDAKVRTLGPVMDDDFDKLVALQLLEARKSFETAEENYATIQTVTITAIAVGLMSALAFGLTMVRSIRQALGAEPAELSAIVQCVANGDLRAPVTLRPGDHTSTLAAIHRMQASLVDIVATVRRNADNVASGSVQIAQGNQDLSQRTEEQASALEQSAASMQQLGSTVKHNADSAREANDLARQASEVAAQGGDVVSQVVSTMSGINESSRRIADIIGVIDGIAFQTNILALNAAVEAARAGEQGRGFAVVASEVRTLAQRSAEAAREIKTLITASVEQVAQGNTLVDHAGNTMGEVVNAIRRVTDIMTEITAATTEQSAGVAQVGAAVSMMDQATQQNAALVEESAAAAESLRLQAQQLVQAVSIFKLSSANAATPA